MDTLCDLCHPQVTVRTDVQPVAVGGVGGSGTRVLAQILLAIGYQMGRDLNESLDDLSFTALFKRAELLPLQDHLEALDIALAVYLTARGVASPQDISAPCHRRRTETLLEAIAKSSPWREDGTLQERLPALATLDVPSERWGWKEPNTMILLPYLLQALPQLRYIHVVRDGRDMAFSANKNQLELWGEYLLGRSIDGRDPADMFDYWCHTQRRVLEFSNQHPTRILIINLETAAETPHDTLGAITDFLGVSLPQNYDQLVAFIKAPTSLNRYLAHPPLPMSASQKAVMAGLGYTVD